MTLLGLGDFFGQRIWTWECEFSKDIILMVYVISCQYTDRADLGTNTIMDVLNHLSLADTV